MTSTQYLIGILLMGICGLVVIVSLWAVLSLKIALSTLINSLSGRKIFVMCGLFFWAQEGVRYSAFLK